MKRAIFFLLIFAIAACSKSPDFSYGIEQLNSINSKFGVSMENSPMSANEMNLMLADLEELKKARLDKGQVPFEHVVNYRILNIEADRDFIGSQKYGGMGITKDGFGCKQRPLIVETHAMKMASAEKAYRAVDLVRKLVSEHPEEASEAGLSEKNALFLNASFYKIVRDANSDLRTINNLCPENRTLELYKEEFRKKTNLSGDFISNLGYSESVKIWKNLMGIE